MSTERNAGLHWIAEYADGSTVTEADTTYTHLKREGLVAFGLFTTENKPCAIINLQLGQTLFFRMRVFKSLAGTSKRIYMIGYRSKPDVLHLTVVDADGKISSYSNFKDAGLDTLEFFPQEQVPP
jgi:hypothetical protein